MTTLTMGKSSSPNNFQITIQKNNLFNIKIKILIDYAFGCTNILIISQMQQIPQEKFTLPIVIVH